MLKGKKGCCWSGSNEAQRPASEYCSWAILNVLFTRWELDRVRHTILPHLLLLFLSCFVDGGPCSHSYGFCFCFCFCVLFVGLHETSRVHQAHNRMMCRTLRDDPLVEVLNLKRLQHPVCSQSIWWTRHQFTTFWKMPMTGSTMGTVFAKSEVKTQHEIVLK